MRTNWFYNHLLSALTVPVLAACQSDHPSTATADSPPVAASAPPVYTPRVVSNADGTFGYEISHDGKLLIQQAAQ